MAKGTIQPKELGLGRVILLATDSVGMACEGAFWLYDRHEERWLFFLVTSLIDTMGPRQIYLLLDKALPKRLSEEEVNSVTIYITPPQDPLVKLISEKTKTDRRATFPYSIEVTKDGEMTVAVVYRMASGLLEREVRKAQKRFQKLSELEVA